MRLLPIFFLMFSCAAWCQILNNPNKRPACPTGQNQQFHNCWGASIVNGHKYVGEWKEGKPHGKGTYTYDNGDKHVGEFKYNNAHGWGTYTYANGDKYVGEFKDDKMHGQGTYYFSGQTEWKGDKYVGEFKDGKMHGQGTYTYANGTNYVGQWEYGARAKKFKVNAEKKWVEGWGERDYIAIQSLNDQDVTITKIILNRGNCPTNFVTLNNLSAVTLPYTLKFGQTLTVDSTRCRVIEVTVRTPSNDTSFLLD